MSLRTARRVITFRCTIGMMWNPSRMLLLNGPTCLARSVVEALRGHAVVARLTKPMDVLSVAVCQADVCTCGRGGAATVSKQELQCAGGDAYGSCGNCILPP